MFGHHYLLTFLLAVVASQTFLIPMALAISVHAVKVYPNWVHVLFYLNFISSYVFVCVCNMYDDSPMMACHSTHVENRGYLLGGSLFVK